MSRRFNLGILKKSNHQVMKDLTFQELMAKYGSDEDLSVSSLSQEVFCIGKAFDDSFLKPFATPAFSSAETNRLVNEEHAFYLISQEGFKALIEDFRKTIAANFKELLGDPTKESKEEENARFSYIYFRLQEWGNDLGIKPYDLDRERITTSSSLEYAIFELIRIYKTVDWENELVAISAW